MTEEMPWITGGLFCASLLCLWGNLRQLRRRRLLADTPTSKALGVFIGTAELKGTAESTAPVTSFLALNRCVVYAWSVEESWSRTVTETYTDDKGNTKTRTRHESGWTTVASGGETIPFYLKDETGVILVQPDGATIEPHTFFSETVGRSDPLYYTKGPQGSVAHSDHRRRFVETGIALHTPLFVIGSARERADIVAPEIARQPDTEMFLISTRSEEKIQSSIGGWAWLWGVLGFAFTCVPLIVALAQIKQTNHFIYWVTIPPVIYVSSWLLGWVWMVYNSLVGLRQRVRQGWSLIDVQLKRRFDLIPKINAAINALGSHEQSVQTALARLRSQREATAPGVPGSDYSGIAATVRGVVERYPEITAHTGFVALQKELVETEQRIALARSYYNDIATEFAIRLSLIPDRWVATLRRMEPEPLLQAADFERAPVHLDLQ